MSAAPQPVEAPRGEDAPAIPPIPPSPPAPRTLASYERRDVRNAVAKVRGW